MLPEMKVYESQINLKLLNSIVWFVTSTANATVQQTKEISSQHILLTEPDSVNTFQQDYGFLYLGELLERYEERYGMALTDLRAIALALGYTRNIATPDMFIGNQRSLFLQTVRQKASGDVYLLGALYLLEEGQSGAVPLAEELSALCSGSLETLLFAMSVFPDFSATFLRFKPQLLHLLSDQRTVSVLENTWLYNWLVTKLSPLLKTIRTKDMALFRALCSLPGSFVKAGSRQHDILLQHGYSPIDIAYANIMLVLYRTAPKVLWLNSLTTEKLVISLFKTVLGSDGDLPQTTYDNLSVIFNRYTTFNIKCNGHSKLESALSDAPAIRSPAVFSWFSNLAHFRHSVFREFNILDPHWDPLASTMRPDLYRVFFEMQIRASESSEVLRQCIDRYDKLTGTDYVQSYWEESSRACFGVLVEKEIIDIWQAFCSSVDSQGEVVKPMMIDQIKSYIHNLRTPQSFDFLMQFLSRYGLAGMERYFDRVEIFAYKFAKETWGNTVTYISLDLSESYLNTEKLRMVVYWLDEFYYTYQPKKYLSFIVSVLKNKTAADVLSVQEQRALFDLVIDDTDLFRYGDVTDLKRMYLTAEELLAEKQAAEIAQQEKEQEGHRQRMQAVREQFTKKYVGTFSSLLDFTQVYRSYHDERLEAYSLAYAHLPLLLAEKDSMLTRPEIANLLILCGKLVNKNVMNIEEAQDLISKIKEEHNDGENDIDKCA